MQCGAIAPFIGLTSVLEHAERDEISTATKAWEGTAMHPLRDHIDRAYVYDLCVCCASVFVDDAVTATDFCELFRIGAARRATVQSIERGSDIFVTDPSLVWWCCRWPVHSENAAHAGVRKREEFVVGCGESRVRGNHARHIWR